MRDTSERKTYEERPEEEKSLKSSITIEFLIKGNPRYAVLKNTFHIFHLHNMEHLEDSPPDVEEITVN